MGSLKSSLPGYKWTQQIGWRQFIPTNRANRWAYHLKLLSNQAWRAAAHRNKEAKQFNFSCNLIAPTLFPNSGKQMPFPHAITQARRKLCPSLLTTEFLDFPGHRPGHPRRTPFATPFSSLSKIATLVEWRVYSLYQATTQKDKTAVMSLCTSETRPACSTGLK